MNWFFEKANYMFLSIWKLTLGYAVTNLDDHHANNWLKTCLYAEWHLQVY